ncbi:SIR2 family protein [Vibrio parahaemolyticus]|uniref:SIR2 family protein n=1 Tax=Vibrio TaxID=662 RepID=UPI000996F0E5|nr:SIR2 family protein [Vibrio fluvialis]EGR0214126.1 fibronectin-binding protein (FBP) [Vibrio parahaemolyticus]EJA3294436.1 SIR2 family protein [Vibrio vulnificus]EGW0144868.1 fibronectin-binding protein (FBP) [Vibrio parahaemolyticus]EHR6683470.1 SIR2 family protein [Vibrio parahaemolyticus]EHU5174874.1 SIR2 family protein [Vibrio parahaemolyticus]
MEQNNENRKVTSWNITLKVFEDKQPRHFTLEEGKLLQAGSSEEALSISQFRLEVEPWLTALFQNEHLNLLAGSGLTCAASYLASKKAGASMDEVEFKTYPHKDLLLKAVETSAKGAGRDQANIEDQIRTANKLLEGLEILEHNGNDYSSVALQSDISNILSSLINSVLATENLIETTPTPLNRPEDAAKYLMSFLLSFASRTASRDRLHIFTTNYDRLIEWAADMAGIRLMDRFVGSLNPIFRSSRLELDMHYNPPGIRGEPRYLEGLARYSKLHGSLDWSYQNRHVRKVAIPFGAASFDPYMSEPAKCLIFPNSAKDRETSEFPYVELFRDFAAAICRPNTVLVCYGYGFGDEHINRVIEDMLSIPSTHLVIISLDNAGNRISNFYERVGRSDQISLMIGVPFADIVNLVDNFLPKPAIDLTTQKVQEIIASRGWDKVQPEKTRQGE